MLHAPQVRAVRGGGGPVVFTTMSRSPKITPYPGPFSVGWEGIQNKQIEAISTNATPQRQGHSEKEQQKSLAFLKATDLSCEHTAHRPYQRRTAR